MNKLLFLFELSIGELKKNLKINIIVIFSLALGILMPIIALANINVFWVNVKNLYPEISENAYYCNVTTGHLTEEMYSDIAESLGAVILGGYESRNEKATIRNQELSGAVGAISEDYLDFVKYDLLEGRGIEKEEIHSAEKVCMIEESLLSQYGLSVEIGEDILIGGEPFQIRGIFRTMEHINKILVPSGVFDGEEDLNTNQYAFFIQCEENRNPDMLMEQLAEKVENVHRVEYIDDYFESKRESCFANSVAIFAITIPLMVFSLINCILVLYGKIARMRYEIGIKMALGAEKKEIFFACFFENSLLSIIAYCIDLVILPMFSKTVPQGLILLFDAKIFVLSFLILELLCFVMSFSMTRKIMKLDIATVLKGE